LLSCRQIIALAKQGKGCDVVVVGVEGRYELVEGEGKRQRIEAELLAPV
jgi:hypothetical protein